MLAQALVQRPTDAPTSLNFAPDPSSHRSVAELVDAFTAHWGGGPGWRRDCGEHAHEASLLTLDATCARETLGWRPLLSFAEAVAWTADWYSAFWRGDDVAAVTGRQIEAFSAALGRNCGVRMGQGT
jgi:CDP-glucose 4,6-dehydratase